jgi:acyl carrier protein phosphodiesterase
MNFLAHLFLAEPTSDSIIGTMLADFVNTNYHHRYNKGICWSIVEHREVDKFTDSHPIFIKSKHRISDHFRLLKGIMIDVFYDHYLAKNWTNYSDTSLENFCRFVYQIFLNFQNSFPQKMQGMIPRMIQENWLLSYREIDGIDWVLKGLSNRLSKKNNLGAGIVVLKKNYREFELDFEEYFPQLIEFVDNYRQNKSLSL